MRIDILTLFPEMCETVMAESIIGRARKRGAVQVCCHQIRDFAYDKHNRVDDTLFGGGMGMLMMAEPIALCMDDLVEQLGKKPHVLYMSPQGSVLSQEKVKELAMYENIAILCGHYEGCGRARAGSLCRRGNLDWRLCADGRRTSCPGGCGRCVPHERRRPVQRRLF